ncbi:MAG TPA: hypothetical protein VFR56_07360 [Actinomycetes bacterium]|nr:hypothetical protein [Actinomycetes bacterium]
MTTTTYTAGAGNADLDLADTVVMTLLHDHVPLALLCDLTLTDGPTSAAILAAEGEPETRWWER